MEQKQKKMCLLIFDYFLNESQKQGSFEKMTHKILIMFEKTLGMFRGIFDTDVYKTCRK